MKTKKLLLTGMLSIAVSFGADAQINNSTQPETIISSAMNNTGLAIAPNLDVQAATFANGLGSWRVYWINGSTGAITDIEGGAGYDPDVAYNPNANLLGVVYENGGNIIVNRYQLVTASPATYNLNASSVIGTGTYPNIDISSSGYGVVSWEFGGMVYVSAFKLGSMTFSPPIAINPGTQPDAIVLDDDKTIAITYVDLWGNLRIETIYLGPAGSGIKSPIGAWGYPGMVGYEYPRIASQRNSGFGPAEDFTVVAQDHNGFTPEVHAVFANFAAPAVGPIVVNSSFFACPSLDPFPVVAYNQGRVQIAWSQRYPGGCSGLFQTIPNNEDDILMRSYNPSGVTSPWHEEINQIQSNFTSHSKTSLSTEYDGNFSITSTNWHEGVLFNDPINLFWKTRNAGNPSYIDEQNVISETRDDNFSLITSPVDQTIEVLSESDDLATFQMLDNAGRVVELKSITNNGNVCSIDISHLSGGIYFLNCSSSTGQQVLRILQVTK